jgi:HK97 family phage portal protein
MVTLLQSAQQWVARLFTRSAPKSGGWRSVGVNLSGPGTGFFGAPGAIDADEALTLSAVSCCVSLISKTIAALPRHLLRLVGEGRERSVENPLYNLLHSFPNDEMGAVDFWETLISDALLYGNGFAEITRHPSGEPAALWNLSAQYMQADRDAWGNLFYFWAKNTPEEIVLPASNVIHIRTGPINPNDGIFAVSILDRAGQSLGLNISAENVASSMMMNGLRPSAVLQHPGRLSSEAVERLRADFTRIHSGEKNAGRVAVLENGMTLNTLGTPPNDAQFLESRQFQVREVARWFQVPLSKLKAIDNPGYKTTDSENQQFLTDCLQPLIIRIEQELTLKCLDTVERRTHRIEHDLNGLLRASIERRVSAYATARNWGWMSANDVRKLENMPPINGGDVYMQPSNMQPLGETSNPGSRTPPGYPTFDAVDAEEADNQQAE